MPDANHYIFLNGSRSKIKMLQVQEPQLSLLT